jgi:deazaflavin-dependent oxidoreductase (nitroreductase family)
VGLTDSQGAPPPKWLKIVNKGMVFAQRTSGAKMGPVHVLTVPGRSSGGLRSTPMSIVELGVARYVVAGYAKSDWVKNARAAKSGTLSAGKKAQRAKIVEVSADEARPVLRAFPSQVPTGAGFMKRGGVVKDGTPEEFEALAGSVVVFRFDPA